MNYNRCVFAGNLTRDPELRNTPQGTPVCQFSIATNRKWTAESGEKKEEVTFLDCEAWGKSAENVAQYFKKGKPIFVQARAKTESWEDKTTKQKRSKIKFVVESWQFCGGDKDATPRASTPSASAPEKESDGGGDDGDVPF
jgi:single-strand DNA-binding protein